MGIISLILMVAKVIFGDSWTPVYEYEGWYVDVTNLKTREKVLKIADVYRSNGSKAQK